MAFVRKFFRRELTGLPGSGVALGLALALSGCQSGDPLGALNIGGGGRQGQPPAGQETITAAELMAYCPAVTLVHDRAVLNSYQRGGDGDASRLVYRAAITDTTRSCTYAGGTTSMSIGIAGRVIPGPAGTPGTIRLPIRVTVYQDTAQIHSQRFDHEVAIPDTAGATQFVVVDNNFSMPNPTSRNVRVQVAFEEASGR